MPFRNTRLIPRGLAQWFAPTVAESMTATVTIRRPDQAAVRNETTGKTTFVDQPAFYAGCARVQGSDPAPATMTPAGRSESTASYLVAVPHDVVEVRPGDLVTVVDDAEDPALAGLELRVIGFSKATVILQRNVRCELTTPAPTLTR